MRIGRAWSVVVVAAALVGPSTAGGRPQETATLVSRLPTGTGRASILRGLGDLALRSTAVHIDREQVARLRERRTVSIELFDDASFTAEMEPPADDGFGLVWRGKLRDPARGNVTLVSSGRRLYGSIRTDTARYLVFGGGAGRARAYQLDLSARLPDRVWVPPVQRAGTRHSAMRRRARSTLDVMVLFTAAAKKQQPPIPGGLKALIRIAVAEMNTALNNSRIDIQMRLVKIKRIAYEKSGDDSAFMSQALADLTRAGDGQMDKVHRLRNRFGADFVALIIQRNIGACGMGWIGGERRGLEDADGDFAFSVTAGRCLSFGTLAHELGHNMGAQHSRLDPVSARAGAYDYSYGHKVENKIQTIMAYNCESPCVSPLAYSNPDIQFSGIAAGVPVGAPDPADNHRSFNNDRRVMEAYRPCSWKCE